ncbi:MAG TPA: 4-hydroxy-tetrahydrodipicolinate synthase [Kofleriaceae bacterium]|nr:4-hydroxy-tetrahydrodipicolinate synthase [Kofleriaceae bacterium]
MTRPNLEGAMTALVTPFKHGAVDHDALTRLVEHQLAGGIDGLVAVGTTGESATLDVDEHIDVVRHVVRVAAGRVPVIAGAGGNSTAEAIELSKRAADVGADALLHVTPYYNRPGQEGMYRHFAAVAAATKLPVLLYNVPTRTGVDLLPDTVVRLAAIDNVVGIKEATGSLPRATELVARCGGKFLVISGDDATTMPLYAVGARGVISVVSNVAPAMMAQMWDAAAAGQWKTARDLHHALRVLNGLLFAEASPGPVKAALHLQGRVEQELRLPMVPVTPGLYEQLRAELARLELLK